jgi:hypothetical protein
VTRIDCGTIIGLFASECELALMKAYVSRHGIAAAELIGVSGRRSDLFVINECSLAIDEVVKQISG